MVEAGTCHNLKEDIGSRQTAPRSSRLGGGISDDDVWKAFSAAGPGYTRGGLRSGNFEEDDEVGF